MKKDASEYIKEYFANLPADEIGQKLNEKVENYYNMLEKYGQLRIWRKSYRTYNNSIRLGGQLNKVGEQDEFTTMNVNHFRNLLQHMLVMTLSQRPAFEARASNNDYKSQSQTILAQGLLDYYMREKRLERNLKQATEFALLFGEGFVEVTWDGNAGELYGSHPDTGAKIYEGDLNYKALSPLDVVRDLTNDNPNTDWNIVRSWENKYDLMAEFPELADRIEACTVDPTEVNKRVIDRTIYETSELVPVFSFYHKPTTSVPNGRFVKFLADDVILLDGPIQYRTLPLFRIAASELSGSPLGYTVAYDLLPMQEALDGLYSTVITNQSTFGVQNIAIPKGSDINHIQLADGLNVLEYDPKLGKPESMNLTHTPPEVFNFIQQLEHTMETISGVNSVSRGNPEASLKSGAALALVQSMALQFSQGLQQSYVQLLEDVGTATINLLRDFAQVPRVAVIAGKANRSLMKEFSGEDLSEVNRVIVDAGNPLTKTTAGKVNLAEQLIQSGLIKTPEEYIQVLNTGRLEPIVEGQTAELLLIKSENEKLADGANVAVLITDDHRLHILEHRAVAASPEARDNPELVIALNTHLQEHITMLKSADPVILQLFGQPAVGGGMAQSEAGNVPQTLDATNPLTQEAAQVNQPNMPNNALTGEQFNPETGGLM